MDSERWSDPQHSTKLANVPALRIVRPHLEVVRHSAPLYGGAVVWQSRQSKTNTQQNQNLCSHYTKTQAEFMLKQAKDKADRMIQDAEKHSAQVRASLIRDIEKVIASL